MSDKVPLPDEFKENKKYPQRTTQQNKALHLLLGMLANALNDAGYDMKKTLREDVDIPWEAKTVKEYLWRPIQQAQLGKDSTTELTTVEIDKVFDTLNRHLGEKTGVHVSFPSIEELIMQYESKRRIK